MVRRYNMVARAQAVEDRRARILEAAYDLFISGGPDAITLEAVAAAADVSLKTVVRQFESKDGLLQAAVKAGPRREEAMREVPCGDVEAIVRVLASRYETLIDIVPKMIALQDRLPLLVEAQGRAIASHTEWLAQAFAPWLPRAGAERKRRIMALYGATEVYTWWMWRRRIGLSRVAAAAAMRELLEALVQRWSIRDEGSTT